MSGRSSIYSPRIAPTDAGHMSHVTRRKRNIQRPTTPTSSSESSTSDAPERLPELRSEESDEAVDQAVKSSAASTSTSARKVKQTPTASSSSSPSSPPTPLSLVSLFRPIDRSRNRRIDSKSQSSTKQRHSSSSVQRPSKDEEDSSDRERDEEFVPESNEENVSSSSESEDEASDDNINGKKATLSKEDLIRQLLQPKQSQHSQVTDADADEDLHESDSSSSDGEVSIAQLRSICTPAALDLDAQYAARELDAHRRERSASVAGGHTGSMPNLAPQLDIQALVDHCVRGGLSAEVQAAPENEPQLEMENGIRVTSMVSTPHALSDFPTTGASSSLPPVAAAAAASSVDDSDDLMCRRSLAVQESRNERDKSRRMFHTKQLIRYTRRFKYAVHIHRIQQEYEQEEQQEDNSENGDDEKENDDEEQPEDEEEQKESHNRTNASQASLEPPSDLPALVDPTQLSREFLLPATVDPDALFMPIRSNRSNAAVPVADEDAETDPSLMQNPECQTMLYRALRQFLQPIIQLLSVVKMQRQFILQNQRKKLVNLHASLRMASYNRNTLAEAGRTSSASARAKRERVTQASPEMSDVEPASSSDSDDEEAQPSPADIPAPAAAALPPLSSTAEFKRQLAETGCITKKDVRDILAILGMQAKLPSFAELTEKAAVPKSPAVTAASAQIPPSPLSGPISSTSSAVGANERRPPSPSESSDEGDDSELSDFENLLRPDKPRKRLNGNTQPSSQSSRKGKPTGVSTFNQMQKGELVRLFESGAISHRQEHETAREACLAHVTSLGTPDPAGGRASITASQVRTFLINYAARLKKKNPQAGRQFLRDMKERGNNRPDSGRKAPQDRIRTPKVKAARRIKRELDAAADDDEMQDEERNSPEVGEEAEAEEQKDQGMRGFIRWDDLTKEQQEEVLRNQSASIRLPSGNSSASKSRKRKRKMEDEEEAEEDEEDQDDRREKKRLKKERRRAVKKEKKQKRRQKRAAKQRRDADHSDLEAEESDPDAEDMQGDESNISE